MNSTLMSILMVMTSLMLISVIKVCLSSLADYLLCFFFPYSLGLYKGEYSQTL
jgi:hypothetical protein